MSEKQPLTNPGYAPPPQAGQNTIIVTNQPPPTFVVYERRYGSGDHYLLLSILVSIVCFFCCGWPTLICTIPAIFFALGAQDAEARGDNYLMEKNARTALFLDICGAITGLISFSCVMIAIIISNLH